MSQGEQAGEAVKGVFKGIGDIGEDIRKNVNSFADDLASGSKSNTTTGAHAATTNQSSTTGIVSSTTPQADGTLGHGTSDRSGVTNSTTQSGDVHPDAKALGSELEKGVDAAGAKFAQWKNKQ